MSFGFLSPRKKRSPKAEPEASDSATMPGLFSKEAADASDGDGITSALGRIHFKQKDDDRRNSFELHDASEAEDRYRPETELDSEDDEHLTDTVPSDADTDAEEEDDQREPSISNLVHLTEKHCRTIYKAKLADGTSTDVVCGRTCVACNSHTKQRTTPGRNRQQAPGWYEALSPARGKVIHGSVGGYYISDKGMEARKALSKEELAQAIRRQDTRIDEDEWEELQALKRASGRRGDPKGPVKFEGEVAMPASSNSTSNGAELAPTSSPGFNSKLAPTPSIGRTAKVAAKMVEDNESSDYDTDTEEEEKPRKARRKKKAVKIVEDNESSDYDTDTEEEETPRKSCRKKKAIYKRRQFDKRRAEKRRAKEQKRKDREREERRRARKAGGRKKRRGRHRGHGRRGRKYDGYSSSSDSSSSSSSEYGYSSSDDSYYSSSDGSSSGSDRRAYRKRTKAARKSMKAPSLDKSLFGPDPSEGNPKQIYGVQIMGDDIDRAMAPDGMSAKSAKGIYDSAVDVTALPGMYTQKALEEAEGDVKADQDEGWMNDLSKAIVENRRGKTSMVDPFWQRQARHGLRKVKDETTFESFIDEVAKCERNVFENQELLFYDYMSKRGYSSDEINYYNLTGLLVRIVRSTYVNYNQLLFKARALQIKHKQDWSSGPGGAMIRFHSLKLAWIRQTSRSKRMHLLRTYTYLRDAQAKSFNDIALTESIWTKVRQLETMSLVLAEMPTCESTEKEQKKSGSIQVCTICRSKALHSLFDLAHDNKAACPLKGYKTGTAKKLVKQILRAHNEGNKDIKAVVEEVKAATPADG